MYTTSGIHSAGLTNHANSPWSVEVVSKRFSLVKIKAGDHFNRRNTLSISRIEM
jgi:hypothetical protein